MTTRAHRMSVSLDGDPRGGASCSRSLLPALLLTSLFFASSAAVISCPADGSECCSPIDWRAALNRSAHSFATCNATAPPAQTPPPLAAAAVQQEPAAAAAKTTEDSTRLPPLAAAPTVAAPEAATAEPVAAKAAASDAAAPQIATFDEWTKQKLQQPPPAVVPPLPPTAPGSNAGAPAGAGAAQPLPDGSAPRATTPTEAAAHAATATRNYASRECGAKVIYANPEAENTKAVLNDKEKDDYMRNPCDKAQHKHIVIELCETIQPRSIEIANFELFSSGPAGVRFSAAERFPSQQWSVLGEWSLADTRTVQTLPVPADKLTYAKFIKLELLAHHGAEHYCTLSTVRVLGVSMVDEYEAEAAAAARLAASAAAAAAPEAVAPAPVAPAPTTAAPTTTTMEQQQAVKKDEPSSLPTGTATPAPVPTEEQPPVASSTEAPPVTVVEAPPVVPKAPPPTPPPTPTGIVQDVMSGTLLKKIIEVVGGRKAQQPRPRGRGASAYAACDRTRAPATCARRAFFCPPIAKSAAAPTPPLTTQQTAERRAAARRKIVAEIQRREEEAAAAAAAAAQPPTQIEAPPHRKATTTPPVVVPEQQQPSAAPAAPKEEEATSPPPPAAAAKPQLQQQPVAAPAATPAAQPPVGIFEGLPAGTSSHKESVFMKLNKRIAALELNMSLSTEYLSELSRQYIAHTDEQKKALERTRVAAERAAVDVARTVNETVRDELFNLRKEVDALSAWLAALRQQAGSVALATPRRISGAHAAAAAASASHHDTSPAPPERSISSSAEVGHRRRQMDHVVDEDARPTCPYKATERRPYGPNPRPEREDGAHSADAGEEHAEEEDAFDLRHFRHHSDGIWTTEQVLYAVLGAQAATVALVLAMQFCYARFFARRQRPMQQLQQQPAAAGAAAPPPPAALVDPAELERLIAAALDRRAEREREAAQPPPLDPVAAAAAADASPRSSASSVTSSELQLSPAAGAAAVQQHNSGNKKRRRQRRSTVDQQQQHPAPHHHHQCRQCGGGANLDWDSAMDSSLPSPSQTGSEEEFEAPPPTSSGSLAPPTSGATPSSPAAAAAAVATTPKR